MSICIALILDLSFSFHNIVSLPYIRVDTNNVSCKTLAYSRCKLLTLIRDLMAPRQPSSHLPPSYYTLSHLYLIHPKHLKYLNSETCSNLICLPKIHSNPSSPFSTITLLLTALTFKSLLLYISTKHPTTVLRSSSYLLHKTISSVYKRLDNLFSLLTPPEILLSSFPFPFIPLSSLHPYIYWRVKGTLYTPVSVKWT